MCALPALCSWLGACNEVLVCQASGFGYSFREFFTRTFEISRPRRIITQEARLAPPACDLFGGHGAFARNEVESPARRGPSNVVSSCLVPPCSGAG